MSLTTCKFYISNSVCQIPTSKSLIVFYRDMSPGCFKKQKKALRAITFTKWNAHTTPLFKHLNILTVYDINKLQILCFVYKAVNNLLP